MNQQQNTADRPAGTTARNRTILIVGSIALAGLLVVYFFLQLFALWAPRLRTQFAIPYTMVDSFDVQGVVVMPTVDVTGGGSGIAHYSVEAGQRVAAGQTVVELFGSTEAAEAQLQVERIDAEIAQLQQAQTTAAERGDTEMLLTNIQNNMYSIAGAVEQGHYAEIEEPRAQVVMDANKIQIATGTIENFEGRIAELTTQREQYAATAAAQATVQAPQAGYFAPSANFDRVPFDKDQVEAASAGELQQMMAQSPQYYSSDVVGHIVSSYEWQFATVVPLAISERFVVGSQTLQIIFPDIYETPMKVRVDQVQKDESGQFAKVILHCEIMSEALINLRVETASIIFSTQYGLRVEKDALRVLNGEQGVYVRIGNRIEFRRVQILMTDEFYVLAPMNTEKGDPSQVKLYDEIVVEGTDLYDEKQL